MTFIATITLIEHTIPAVFTPASYAFAITNATGDEVYKESIALGTGSVSSLPFDIPDDTYTATAQLVDSDGTARGTAISQPFTLPLPSTTTTAQVPAVISIAAA